MRFRRNSSSFDRAAILVSKEWILAPNKSYMYLEFDPSIHHIFGRRYEAKIEDGQFLTKGEYSTYDKRSEWLPLNLMRSERHKVIDHIADVLYDIKLTVNTYQVRPNKLMGYFETHPEMAVEWDWMQSIPLGSEGIYTHNYIAVKYKIVNLIWAVDSETNFQIPALQAIIYVPHNGRIELRDWNTIKANNELIDFEIPQWVKDLGT